MLSTIKRKNLVFNFGYMYRFNPKVKEALEKVKRGDLGEIYAVEAHMDCLHPAEVRDWLKAFPGGMLFFLGCHLIDLIYRVQGEPCEILPLSCASGFDGTSGEDYGMVAYRYPSGVSFAKTTALEPGGFMRRQLVLCGEKGTIEINPLEVLTEGGQYTLLSENVGEGWHTPWSVSQSEIYDRYEDMMRNFAELVRGKENPYTYEYELGLYRLLLRSCGKEIVE